VFENLKQRSRWRFNNKIVQDHENNLNMAWAVQILMKVRHAIGQDEILSAWEDFYPHNEERDNKTWKCRR
jgi:hypothetical protein